MKKEKIARLPTQPGVYLMKNKRGKILYVGKAKNLRQRVRQYFTKGGDGRYQIPYMMPHVHTVETIVVPSEKDALLLENNLIKEHKPQYNVFLKDDRSYIAIHVRTHKKWPDVQLVRYRGQPKGKGEYFGPYTNAHSARETLDLLQRLFPLRQCSDREFARRTRPCILYEMGRCVAPCVDYVTEKEYQMHVRKTISFLKGSHQEVVKDLKVKMEVASDKLEYEKANTYLKTIKHIEKTLAKQYVEQPYGNDRDVLALYREGDEVLLAQVIYRGGKLLTVQTYSFSKIAQSEMEILQSFLLQHYGKHQMMAGEILLPVEIEDQEVVEELLKVKLLVPKKGEKKVAVEMARKNAESAYKQSKDQRAILERTLLEMQELLRLKNYPERIECFDTSHLGGDEPVAAMIAFTQGKEDKAHYRKYKIAPENAGDDYGAMYEVLTRRYVRAKKENNLPDLIIVDGGKGQLNVALKVLRELNIITIDVIGLAKEEGRHDKGITQEKVFLPEVKDAKILNKYSPLLLLLQRMRDEAHRFAIAFQRKRKVKQVLKSSLDDIPGVGPARKRALLKHFGSLKGVKKASVDEIARVPGFSKALAEAVAEFNAKAQRRKS